MAENMSAPAVNGVVITASDTAGDDVEGLFRSLWVGTGGAVAVVHATGSAAVVWPSVPSGSVLPVRGVRVAITGTTASGIIGMK